MGARFVRVEHTRKAAAAAYDGVCKEIEDALVAVSGRWGDEHRDTPYTRDVEWTRERDWLLKDYFPKRSAIAIDQFREAGLYIDGPEFSPSGGPISSEMKVTISGGPGKIYYTLDGTDPRAIGGGVAAGATCYSKTKPIRLARSTVVKARLLERGKWSALTVARFTSRPQAERRNRSRVGFQYR